jgi:CubicO group peptidase (beta-lactamase class C family)
MTQPLAWSPTINVALLCCCAALVLACTPGEYFAVKDADVGQRLDAYLQAVMESRPMPGLGVAVVKDGRIIFADGLGVRALGAPDPVTPATIFHTASVSKAFVATAAVRLAGEGRLDLDAPVTRYLPYFRLADGREGEITIRHMLTHTSGMPDIEDYGWDTPEFDEAALERYVRSLSDQRLLFGPGTKWSYSNMAYDVLGDVLSKVAAAPFEEVIRRAILAPLEMNQSSFLPIQHPSGDQASPHRGALSPTSATVYPYHRAHAPSSTLRSNALDLARFANAMLRRDHPDGVTILSDSLKDVMWRPQAEVDRGIKMGLGWFLRSHRATTMVVAPGRDPGFNALIALLPDRGVGVVLLANYDGQSWLELVELADGVFDVGLGRDPNLPKASVAVPLGQVLAVEGIDAAIAEYRRLRETEDPRYVFGISDLITLGHDLRQSGRMEEAIRFYRLNADEYPDYFASHSALAEAYLQRGDTTRALESYRRVLSMNPERYGCPESCYRDKRLDALLANR